MGQSIAQNYLNLITGTKNRLPLITTEVETPLHGYIAGAFKNMKSPVLAINSVPDHIHILFRLSKNYALAKVVEEFKKESSKWVKTKGVLNFKWQIGYGAFSVSPSGLKAVERYIQNQKEHHKKQAFREEVEEFMDKYGASEYEREFFWR